MGKWDNKTFNSKEVKKGEKKEQKRIGGLNRKQYNAWFKSTCLISYVKCKQTYTDLKYSQFFFKKRSNYIQLVRFVAWSLGYRKVKHRKRNIDERN